ncbi:MAG: hydrogenase maturation protease [Pseudomonadota bacterium]
MTLIIGYGNPGRGDDGLGPELARRLQAQALPGVTVISDFQLKVEHSVDVAGADRTVFLDAAIDTPAPFEFHEIAAAAHIDISSHRVRPETVVALAKQHFGTVGPVYVMAIRGVAFEVFSEDLSAEAAENLSAAEPFLVDWLGRTATSERPPSQNH